MKTIRTLPRNPRYIEVSVLNIEAQLSDHYVEAWATVVEHFDTAFAMLTHQPEWWDEDLVRQPRKGRVRIDPRDINDVVNSTDNVVRLEVTDIEWEDTLENER